MASNVEVKDFTYTMEQLATVMKNMGVTSNTLTLNAYRTFLEKLGYKLEAEGCIFDVEI